MAGNTAYNEATLVEALRQRDQQAFAYLYDNYSAALYGVITRLVPDEQLAEDLLQESFVKIWNNFDNYDTGKGRLFTWMLNLARNSAIDTLRSKGYKKQSKISTDENSVYNYEDGSYGKDSFDALGIRKYVATLNPAQQTIINMAYFGGYTQDEIARELAIPLGTVKTRMRAAVFELRKLLQNK